MCGSSRVVTTPATPSSVVDSNGDTLITAIAPTGGGEGSFALYLFVVGSGGSSFSITVNFVSTTYYKLAGFNYTGVNTTAPLDHAGILYHGNSTSPATGASLTPSQSGDEQLAILLNASAFGSWGSSLVAQSALAGSFLF